MLDRSYCSGTGVRLRSLLLSWLLAMAPDPLGVYVRSQAGQLHVVRLDDHQPLVSFGISAYQPQLVPGGVIFAARQKGQEDIWIRTGAAVRRLTRPGTSSPSFNPVCNQWPAKAGDHLVYASNREGDLNRFDLFAQGWNGGPERRLTRLNAFTGQPSAGSSGKILFASNQGDGKTFDLYEMALDGKGLKRLTHHPMDETAPVWHPSGRVLFAANWEGRLAIYALDPLTQVTRKLRMPPSGDVYAPVVLRDGGVLATLREPSHPERRQLVRLTLDGEPWLVPTRESASTKGF